MSNRYSDWSLSTDLGASCQKPYLCLHIPVEGNQMNFYVHLLLRERESYYLNSELSVAQCLAVPAQMNIIPSEGTFVLDKAN